MIIWDDSWCSLTPLEMKTRAGVPLMLMAVCWSRKCEEYVCVTSRMVDDAEKWNVSVSLLGCRKGERKRTMVELGGGVTEVLGSNVIECGRAVRWKQEKWYIVCSASW